MAYSGEKTLPVAQLDEKLPTIVPRQGWLSPRQKGISPLPWGETGEKRGEIPFCPGEMAEKGEIGEKLQMC